MDLTLGLHFVEAVLFGLVFSALYHCIAGWTGWRPYLAGAAVLAGLAYIILFGVVKL